MSIVIITIQDTDAGVVVRRSEVADPGEVNTPAMVLGAAAYDNISQYLDRHPNYGRANVPAGAAVH